MEVHQHTHTPRKKWTHYFWEFLMLFLAVFCGFLAEYQLEHKIEKSRERQYIKSFVEDLEADVIDMEMAITLCDHTVSKADSLISLLAAEDKQRSANDIYYFFRYIHRSTPLNVNDRTIVQLRNAGGMRLIKNKNVADSIVQYYKEIDFVNWLYEEQTNLKRSLRPHYTKILDGIDYGKVIDEENRVVRTTETLKLRSEDPETINACILILQNIKGLNKGIGKIRLKELSVEANRIRSFIVKEYGLKLN